MCLNAGNTNKLDVDQSENPAIGGSSVLSHLQFTPDSARESGRLDRQDVLDACHTDV